MINPGKALGTYRIALSGDPAIVLPDDDKARALALRTAREQDDYAAITRPGQRPTFFHMRTVPYAVMQRWADLRRAHGGPLGPNEALVLLFQLALVRVENFGDVVVELVAEPRVKSERASDAILDQLRAAARECGLDADDLLLELAGAVWAHEDNSDPKS